MSTATRSSPRSDQTKLDDVLKTIRDADWTLGRFLYVLFTDFGYTGECKAGKSPKRTPRHAGFVGSFLSKAPKNELDGVEHIIAAIYNHHDSASIATRHRSTSAGPAAPPEDHTTMAQHKLLQWARTETTIMISFGRACA